LAHFGRLTQGGVVLFGKQPARHFPQVRVRAACFEQDKASDKFRDMKAFEGPLVPVLNQVFDFVVRNTPTVSRFVQHNLQRKDESLYPSKVVREALVNALPTETILMLRAASRFTSIRIVWKYGTLALCPPESRRRRLPRRICPSSEIRILPTCSTCVASWKRSDGQFHDAPDVPGKWLARSGMGFRRKTGCDVDVSRPGSYPGSYPGVTPEVTPEVRLVLALKGEMSRQELQSVLKLKDAEHFRKAYLLPAIDAGLVEMTVPDKPKSGRQRYRLTSKGRRFKRHSGDCRHQCGDEDARGGHLERISGEREASGQREAGVVLLARRSANRGQINEGQLA